MFREAMEVHCGDEGRVKKYSFNLFIPSDAELSGTIVAVQEVPPLNVGGHWAKEMDDEFLFHYINAPFGIPSKR
ncbi:MAG: hypothetical protein IPL19_08535 [Sandaracinaceae bacterium]|nr:hypothetical protein [Sandaracinaceae bacterium]